MSLQEVLKEIGENYVIIGAHAMRFYGYSRYTADLDLLVDLSNEQLQLLANKLKNKGVNCDEKYIPEEDIFEPLGSILRCECCGQIDIIQSKYPWHKDAIKNYVIKNGVKIVDIHYLALLKLDAHGFKDLEDIKYLISHKDFDKNKFMDLLGKYNFHRKYSKILAFLGITDE